jgi:hypothetical protein
MNRRNELAIHYIVEYLKNGKWVDFYDGKLEYTTEAKAKEDRDRLEKFYHSPFRVRMIADRGLLRKG